ncbi:unnamed protein product [Meganyctiphanes norvegica]|uniref:Ig-like domain-containing protein n=1 Tax=Meganyctiphanes norvegica TaxID=48144 RepID=A0AAV2QKU8_MEGNR
MFLLNTPLCLLLLMLLLQQGVSMRIRNFEVPLHVNRGEDVTLKCEFELQDEKLYSIKWYKGGREFFRYVPHERPQKAHYNITGVNVDMGDSDGQIVMLRSVTLATSGRYKCEVLAEAPAFNTLVEHAILTVVEIPHRRPVVVGGRRGYQPGDMVRLNCTSSPSKPAATLTWFINGKKVSREPKPDHYLTPYQPLMLEDGLEVSTLGLTFRATREHFPDNLLSLRCSSEIGIYHNQTIGDTYQDEGHMDNQHRPAAISLLSRDHFYANSRSGVSVRTSTYHLMPILLTAVASQVFR